MHKSRRERVMTHASEDEKEDKFLGLKTELEVLSDLNEIFADDPQMQRRLFLMKTKLKKDIDSITS